jgi:hypothetical protein
MPGHAGIATQDDLTAVHRAAVTAVLDELDLVRDRDKVRAVVVLSPEDLYE